MKYRKTGAENWFEKIDDDGSVSSSFTNTGEIGKLMWVEFQAWLAEDVGNVPDEYVNNALTTSPVDFMREERDRLLIETDWWANSDLTMTSAQTAYRQQLRDLPENSTPALDEDGNLTGVTWPTVPE